MINSKTNNLIKETKKLYQKKYRTVSKLFIVEGQHLVDEAYKQQQIKYIISDHEVDYDCEVHLATTEVLNYLDELKTSQGIIAVCKMQDEEKAMADKIILLDGINDPGNFGTILRSASGFGFSHIICSNDTVDVYNPKVVRASQGAIFDVTVIYTDLVQFIYDHDYQFVCLDLQTNNTTIDFENKIALIVGNEAHGVCNEVKAIADERFKIVTTNIESLNAGVAASIMMYEVSR